MAMNDAAVGAAAASPCVNDSKGESESLSVLDRFLTLIIFVLAGAGLALGQLNGVQKFIATTTVGSTNLLVAVGLMVMMFPALAKVQWDIVHRVFTNWKMLVLTVVVNWIVGPLVMFFLAAAFFHDQPGYMSGLILVGCARCIAMVVVWNALAGGDKELCAAIVAVNSVATIALYAPNVGIYMGIPFVCVVITWYVLGNWKGYSWYHTSFTPRIEVLTVLALLLTILVLFASQSERITANLGNVVVAFVPLLMYFFAMFFTTFFMCKAIGGSYAQCVALAFTAASNNFELAMAIAIATFGLKSDLALMSVVGASMEIPAMLVLVKLSLWLRTTLHFQEDTTCTSMDEHMSLATSEEACDDHQIQFVELEDAAYCSLDKSKNTLLNER